MLASCDFVLRDPGFLRGVCVTFFNLPGCLDRKLDLRQRYEIRPIVMWSP